jgi:hypothetical protein
MFSDDVREYDQLLRTATRVQSSKPPVAGEPKTGLTDRPIEDAIKLRAYQIYVSRGGIHGRDLEDWLQAEREVTALRAVRT